MQSEDQEIVSIAHEIEAYLSTHPRASDTLIGVLQWWLTQQRYMEAKERVEFALNYLVQEGKVNMQQLPGGRVLYSKADRKKDSDDN